jgi:hypothetical protein
MSSLQSNSDDLNTDKLNDQDKAELRQFLSNEQQRAQIQARMIYQAQSMCFSILARPIRVTNYNARNPYVDTALLEEVRQWKYQELDARPIRRGLLGKLC